MHFTFAGIGLSFFFVLSRVLRGHASSHQLKYGSVLKQRGLAVHRATRLTKNRQSRCANFIGSHVSFLAKFAPLNGLLNWRICTLFSNVKVCWLRYKARRTITREHWNENAHWGEMTYGMKLETTTGCGIQEGYAGPSNNSSGLLIAWYPIYCENHLF